MRKVKIANSHYLEILSNFTDKALKWKLADQELGAFLVLTNFTVSEQIKLAFPGFDEPRYHNRWSEIMKQNISTEERQFQGDNGEVSLLHQWSVQTSLQPLHIHK